MVNRKFVSAAIPLILAAIVSSRAFAWNSSGHMIVGLVAYDQMDAATREKAIQLLRAHPRFHDHFQSAMPSEVSRASEAEQAEWIFAYAGTWPDVVRDARGGVNRQDVARFNRPWWHFINEPVYLNDDERRQLEATLRVNRRREVPHELDDPDMNIIQAFKNSSRIVEDTGALAETRAVHLCWLIHLAGDSHQPMHAAALFTTHRFPRGDHGGNYLEFQHDWHLHAFWDEQISNDQAFDTLRRIATDIGANRNLTQAGRRAAGATEIDQWIDESNGLAKKYAYSKEVLQKVGDREGHSHLGPLNLSSSYTTDAENLAERRAVEAGHRLARVCTQLLKQQP